MATGKATPLPADAKRLRTIIIATPFLVGSSILLYKRLMLGEEQRLLPRPTPPTQHMIGRIKKAEQAAQR
ncbi:BZ3500_MvSof-1268-A1-R1_Chr11-2g03439 [Microbotryum saponariae]|uniref:BZ3500_MvSof-1268-A1-R1_Chr11-2g03439 protein n=1 Tax=Microbotryum saponariae TaxID=289078 RepID=A0A2X0LEP5_9BASI|nr:BZ3500_MvSof-1268-A1-R1_Chr11-2g03439 [Microbotryum saponariae]SDA03378.1 BZ3501_MvSof-1269-A2-R1_Chr11g03010 [Microbotryum saponariae]